jgi:hypothetical protein
MYKYFRAPQAGGEGDRLKGRVTETVGGKEPI